MSAPEGTQTQVDEQSENDDAEAEGVEQLEAKESVSAEQAERSDAQVLEELEQSRGAGESVEDLFEGGGTRAAGPLKVSPNFRLAEFSCKDAKRTPVPAAAVPNVRRLARDVLEPMRAKFGPCTVVSGYRTTERNGQVGGKSKSWHLYHERGAQGVAADLIFARGTPREWHAEADKLNPKGGLGLYPTFVHVDNRPGRARW